jgi:hypothetical protein
MPLKIGPVQWYIIGSLKAAAAQAKDEEIDSTNHEIVRLKKSNARPKPQRRQKHQHAGGWKHSHAITAIALKSTYANVKSPQAARCVDG